jgi:hypothetical protein
MILDSAGAIEAVTCRIEGTKGSKKPARSARIVAGRDYCKTARSMPAPNAAREGRWFLSSRSTADSSPRGGH